MALKRTPLFETHRRLGAKLVEFGGWEMPIQYTSIIEEHQTVRSSVGIFDVSHMGEIEITGPNALDLVQKLITNDASTLKGLSGALLAHVLRVRGHGRRSVGL
jgi:aminomethyltransferase